MSIKNTLLAMTASLCLSSAVFADVLELNPNHPERHVVVKGDTLWDISSQFLRDPWRWPEIWHINPEIKNPHLIYPGDVISLIFRDGQPMLVVERDRPTIQLSPKSRATQLSSAVPTVPSNAISQFLARPRVLTEKQMEQAGHITSSEGKHLISGTGSKIYALNIRQDENKDFSIFRIGQTYRDPETEEILGYEAIQVSDARLSREGNPATLIITESYRETLLGDIVLPTDEDVADQNFIPHAPENKVSGEIISIADGMSRAGQYQTVVINRGAEDGLETGHVLAVSQSGKIISDQYSTNYFKPKIKIPDERAGLVMVVRVFDHVSYALIMNATKDIGIKDPVSNP